MSAVSLAVTRTIGIDLAAGNDASAMVVRVAWPDGTSTLDSTILTDDEKLGLTILLGQAPPLSYNDMLRGTQAIEALAARKGLDLREFSHAFLDWRRTSEASDSPGEPVMAERVGGHRGAAHSPHPAGPFAAHTAPVRVSPAVGWYRSDSPEKTT